jgi:hypothetical protein
MFNFLKNYLFEPRIAFVIFICFIIGYLVFLDEEGAFKDFVKFGPDPSIKFLGMKVDTWKKVILIYIVGFFSALLQRYYGTVMYDFIHYR